MQSRILGFETRVCWTKVLADGKVVFNANVFNVGKELFDEGFNKFLHNVSRESMILS